MSHADNELINAIERRDLAGIQQALAAGADANADTGGMPILHMAAIAGQPEAVDLLIRAGANVNAFDDEGMSAAMWLALVGRDADQMRAFARLHIAGANLNAVHAANRRTPLDMAAKIGNRATVAFLIAAGVPVGRQTQQLIDRLQRGASERGGP